MKQLLRPTLVRRVFLSLLLASLAIWIVMMGINLSINLGEGKTGQELSDLSRYLADGLSDIDNEAAAAFVRGAVGETHRDAYNWRNFRWIKMQLTDRHGRVLLSNLKPGTPPLHGDQNRITRIHLRQHAYLLARTETPRWIIHLALPMHDVTGILRDDWLGLTLDILIAFPFVFVPVWIAVGRGMKPLNALSERIAARHVDDLSALEIDPKYDELKPLAASLDSLLLQLRAKVSREQAFVHDAAHELRTPIAVISAQAHVLNKATSDAERAEAAQQMDRAIARTAHLIAQLLDLASLDHKCAGQAELLDLAQLVRQDLAQRVPAALLRNVELSMVAPDALLTRTEPQVFRSVFHNLVDNALNYVQAGGHVIVSLSQDDAGLTLSVADDGPGIPFEQTDLVFERFYRGAANEMSGTGLGLAIARKAAAALNGSLRLSAGPGGRGCRFTLAIPAVAVSPSSALGEPAIDSN